MAKRKAAEVIDVGTVPEDQALIQSNGGILANWLGNVQAFLSTARALEVKAGTLETTSAALEQPKTAGADAELQRFIQTARACEKEIAAHWTIAQAVHQFHRLLCGYRDRGAEKAIQAGARAQRLHNAYTQAEARRVADENARRQREAEENAQALREAEVAALERRAVEAEAASEDLSERERIFVQWFVAGDVAEIAARRAGYKDPKAQGARLVSTPKIQRAAFAMKEADAARAQAAAVQAKPLEVAPIEVAAANVTKIGSDRNTWKGEVLDERALVEAVIVGGHGIPSDVLQVNQAKLTEYARSLHELMNRWPGVRAVKSTTTI